MQYLNHFRSGLVVACLAASAALAQESLQVGMNEDAKFVLTGSNFSALGLQFRSPSGSLSPMPLDADGIPDSSPFNFALRNDERMVTIGVLGTPVNIDGTVTLTSGWNSNGYRDITVEYGDKSGVTGPLTIPAEDYSGACPDCDVPPLLPIGVTLDDNLNFTLSGRGHRLGAFEFRSPSGSLRTATSAAPFSSLPTNTASHIRYEQAGEHVVIDGTVTLNSGWSEYTGGRDLTYQYEVAPDQEVETGPFPVPHEEYSPEPTWPILGVRFDDQRQLVLSGTGQQLRNLTLTSQSGSLIPGTAGPFDTVEATTERVAYENAPEGLVSIDGDVTLDTKWRLGHRDTERDIFVNYNVYGSTRNYHRSVAQREYPAELSWPRLSVQVNEEDQITIFGSGQPLTELSLSSRSGSLIPSEDAGPFDSVEGSPNEIQYGTMSNVVVDGTLTLATKWDRQGTTDVGYRYQLDEVSRGFAGTISSYPNVDQGGGGDGGGGDGGDGGDGGGGDSGGGNGGGGNNGVFGRVIDGKVAISFPGEFDLSGVNVQSADGLLVPIPPGGVTAPATPFTFLLANNPNNVSYAAIPGSTVEVSGTWITEIGYPGDSPETDLLIAYGNASFTQVNIPVLRNGLVPEPSADLTAFLGLCSLVLLRRSRVRLAQRIAN